MPPNKNEPLTQSWRRVLRFILRRRRSLLLISALTLSLGAAAAFEPLLLKIILDALEAQREWVVVAAGIGGLFALGVSREAVGAFNNWLTWRTRINVQHELLSETVDRLHRLPLTFHQREGVGASMTRIDRGVQGVVSGLSELAFNLVPSAIYLVVSTVIMLTLDWRVTLAVLLFSPLPAVVGILAAPEQARRERRLLGRWAKIYARFYEVLTGILTVKSFDMEEAEKRRFLSEVDHTNRLVVRGVGRDSRVMMAKNLSVWLARVAVLSVAAWLVVRGQLTLGTAVAFWGYIGGFFAPVQSLVGIYQTLHMSSAALRSVLDILNAEDTLGDAPGAVELTNPRGAVTFERVEFSYPGNRFSLREVDLHVEPGEMVALVGPSGSGKSTLMALLQRFYDPTAGRILVDGHDIRTVKQRSLRRAIGVVLQEPLLFNESVRDNITYGVPDATQDEVERAARIVKAHEFVQQLPYGYDTRVGERGCKLSAGQRQRIAIARALIKDPAILIFDEATSALDVETEAAVQEALAEAIRGRTTFAIAHRLSTVRAADRIFVLQDGSVTEMGRHDELMRRGGTYAAMVNQQAELLLAG